MHSFEKFYTGNYGHTEHEVWTFSAYTHPSNCKDSIGIFKTIVLLMLFMIMKYLQPKFFFK